MQAIHRDKLFRKIERRTEMIDAAVDVIRIGDVVSVDLAAEAEYPGAGGKHRIPLCRFLHVLSTCRNCETMITERLGDARSLGASSPFQLEFMPR